MHAMLCSFISYNVLSENDPVGRRTTECLSSQRRGTTGNHTAVPEFIQKIAHSQPMFYVCFCIELTSRVNRISALLNNTVCKRYISSNNQVALLNHRNDMIICHIESRRYRNTRNVHRLRNLQMLVRDQNQRDTNALNCPEQDIHYHTGKCISINSICILRLSKY